MSLSPGPHLPPPLPLEPAPPAAAPIDPLRRIAEIDTLRGVAVLGILLINIQSFAMPEMALENPTVWGDLTGANRWVWLLSHVFAQQKFMTIFSMLFGAGLGLLAERLEQTGRSAARVHYRRMGLLALFGLLHGYLLWYGDILFIYAICGMLVFLARRLNPGLLLGLGGACYAISLALMLALGGLLALAAQSSPEVLEALSPPADELAREVAAYRGGWLDQMPYRARTYLYVQTVILLVFGLWGNGGLMLIGMALYRWGVLTGARPARFYVRLAALGLAISLPPIALGARWSVVYGVDMITDMFFSSMLNHVFCIPLALGYVALVMLACRAAPLRWLTLPLGAVGRMALSNYLLQTLICTTIFYGHGLGLFGKVERVGQLLIVLGVWTILLILSPLWLRFFRYGPFEWLWRTLTYGTRQPMVMRARAR